MNDSVSNVIAEGVSNMDRVVDSMFNFCVH